MSAVVNGTAQIRKRNTYLTGSREGGLWRMLHWGPLLAQGVIFWISCCTLMCTLMYWPVSTWGGLINLIVFCTWVFLVLYNHIMALVVGPGFLPLKWTPDNPSDTQYLQYCKMCEGYKAPRAHHCRKCQRCVMKMDHHCPWLNTCVGHVNHAKFTYFLFFAPVGCIHATFIIIMSIYHMLWRGHYIAEGLYDKPMVVLTLKGLVFAMFAIGLAIGVTIAVGILFVIQMKTIIKNETGIESWIKDKADYRDLLEGEEDQDFIYPYNLGCCKNLKEVFTWSGNPRSDGVTWAVKDGCNQYTLTIEQIKQKKEKMERTVKHTVTRNYSGSWFPITQGLCVCCCYPLSDEPRIKLSVGDTVLVTRWKKRWLYGDKKLTEDDLKKGIKRVRGWFPRCCVKEVFDQDHPHYRHIPDGGPDGSVKKEN